MSDTMDEGGGPAVVDFADLAQEPAPTGVDPAALKLEGDSIPETLRGKTLADVLSVQTELQRALEASRDTINSLRQSSEALATARQSAPVAQPAAPQEEPELTKEQLRELYEKDPFEHTQYLLERMEKRLAKTVDSRVAPMASTTAAAAEAQARAKFAEEFAVLGNEINQVLAQIPDRGALAQPGAWEQVMYYVRGQHMDKLLEARQKKADDAALENARKREAAGAGSVNSGTRRGAAKQRLAELTPEQKKAAQVLGMSEDDYKAYYF